MWFNGRGNPGNLGQAVGDFFYDELTDAVWRFTPRGWGLIQPETFEPVVIQGPQGPPGPRGGGGSGSGGSGAPTDADYIVETANGDLSAEVLTTTLLNTGAIASASAAQAGRMYFPNNSPYAFLRDTGSDFGYWGPGHKFTPPVNGDFSWINQGGASVATTNGGVYLTAPASTTDSWRCRVKSAPSTPYTITAAFLLNLSRTQTSENNYASILFRESATGELETFEIYKQQNTGAAGAQGQLLSEVGRWNSPTSFSTSFISGMMPLSNPILWMQISDDGSTNRVYRMSCNGINWHFTQTTGRTVFITADQVGFGLNAQNANYDIGMHLLHWEES